MKKLCLINILELKKTKMILQMFENVTVFKKCIFLNLNLVLSSRKNKIRKDFLERKRFGLDNGDIGVNEKLSLLLSDQ